jgi:hypothetical protein
VPDAAWVLRFSPVCSPRRHRETVILGMKIANQQRSSKRASVPSAKTSSSSRSRAPAYRLQNAIGNLATTRLFRAGYIQPKLTVSNPGDASEREADRVADQVMRMPDSKDLATVMRLQLRCGPAQMCVRRHGRGTV